MCHPHLLTDLTQCRVDTVLHQLETALSRRVGLGNASSAHRPSAPGPRGRGRARLFAVGSLARGSGLNIDTKQLVDRIRKIYIFLA